MQVASAAQAPVGLGKAASFAVLAGTTVTNTGSSVVSGDLGVSPGTSITGFPPGVVINGAQHSADTLAGQAQSDLTTAYIDAASRTPANTVSTDLGGQTLSPGVYKAASSLSLTGTVTLNGNGNPNAVFIFQAGSTLITASNSAVSLTGGTQACNVFWQVGSSATLGTTTTFVGSILALTSVSVQTATTVAGRVLARNGQVSLDDNTITVPTCSAPPPTTTTTTTTTLPTTTTTTTLPTTTTTTLPTTTTTTTLPTTTTTTTLPTTTTTTTLPTTTTTTTLPTTTTTTVTPTTVPSAHTGEPWTGWPYWLLVGLGGAFGLVSLAAAVRVRRV
ncbi:MAG: ice-binding family protein [Acidimicrobiales bacterium]